MERSTGAGSGEDPGRVTLRPAGELDISTVGTLEAALTDALARPSLREIVVDLAEVRFLDSSGVRVLVLAATAARERDAVLRVTDPQPVVARVLQITAVGPLLGLADPLRADGPTWRRLT
ncbi:STAS domain-containing protein [Micromonospora thermarum]|uniref:Anti-sigma factor antagonist n=1 Tax=Micromonospora thermarum TaxID=2720024 RepID=A0ABX0ZCE8_9ACTN|nr:STAS domain-containing protein [Micromonospora thermarum]NJP33771.1 STAS domain-containing protein [Micromonospora thermarum]